MNFLHPLIRLLFKSCSILVLFFVAVAAGDADTLTYHNKTSEYTVNMQLFHCTFSSAGNLISITPRYKQRNRTAIDQQFPPHANRPLLQLFGEVFPDTLQMHVDTTDNVSGTVVSFTSPGRSVIWRFFANRYTFSVEATGVAVADTLRIAYGTTSDTLPLFTTVTINNRRVNTVSHHRPLSQKKGTLQWFGIRDHFWTFLVKPHHGDYILRATGSTLEAAPHEQSTSESIRFSFYAGPVTFATLSEAGPECTRLLYPMWFWMRWLSIALLQLFNVLLRITAHPAIAIVLLSIGVKILIAPLYRIAGRWQREVNRQKTLLEPGLSEVNKRYKGEEHTKMTLALHRELGISPLYSLKSLLSAAIQIPVFFAAYHMLSEHIALSQVSLLWISDLALPDRLLALPVTLPFAGDHLNLFPFIMTSVSLLASGIHSDGSLSAELHKKQRNSLLIMAALFFLLLYSSPAGMLLYWTMNNILSLLESLFSQLRRKSHINNPSKDSVQ